MNGLGRAAAGAALARRDQQCRRSGLGAHEDGRLFRPVGVATGQRTQTWLAITEDPETLRSGGYWHNMRQQEPADEVTDWDSQDQLLAKLQTNWRAVAVSYGARLRGQCES